LADLESSGGRLFPLAKLVYGSVLIFCDAVVEAEHAYAEAAAEAAEGSYARYAALLHRGCMVFERGRLDEAKNLAEAALRAMSCGSAKGMATRGMGDIVVGLIAYERDDLDEAERAVLRALGCIRGASGSRQRERASICLARIRMARGDRDGAIAIIESVLSELGSGYRLSQPSLDAWRLRFKLSHAGRRTHVSAREETLAWLAKVERELDPADLPIVHYSSRELLPMMARAYLFLGDSGEALRVLGTALPRAVEAEAVDLEIELRSIEALALDAAGRIEESIASIQTALELGCHEGYIRSFADEGQPMAKLLKRARTRMSPQYRPYIATILASVAHLSAEGDVPSIATACEPAVPAISPSEEAVLSLAAQGLSNAAIAQALFIAESTVKAHLGSTYKKLGADNRAGAIVTARRLGILR
jgi:LuxR family maltose regulon positive regulatory protein